MQLSQKAIDLEDNNEILNLIDMMVYKLYNLEYEDILIIDPETPISREEYENFKLKEIE